MSLGALWLAVGLALGLTGCAQPGSVSGAARDLRTGEPVAGLAVRWVAAKASEACRVREAVTGADGSYVAAGLCGGEAYALELGDRDWLPEAPVEVTVRGEDGERRELGLWRVPAVGGLYLLDGVELRALAPQSGVDRLPLPGGGEVRFPLEIPEPLPTVGLGKGGPVLLLVGAEAMGVEVLPLIAAGPQVFGTTEAPQPVGSWFYLGYRPAIQGAAPGGVREGGTVPGVEVASLPEIGAGERRARVLSGEAVGAGRYGVVTAGGRRVALIEVK